MSGTYKAIGINLKSTPLGESDRLLTILTAEYGLLRAVAPGSRKHQSSLGGRSSLFVVNQLLIVKGRNLDKIIQAESLESYPGLSQDLRKLTASQYLAELALYQALSDQPQTELYHLLREQLDWLEKLPAALALPCLTYAMFHLLKVAGLAPEVNICCATQKPVIPDFSAPGWKVGFSPVAGGVVYLVEHPPELSAKLTATELALFQQLPTPDLLQKLINPDEQWPLLADPPLSVDPHLLVDIQTWLSIERVLRHYAQYHFDRPIRSATLIDSCFAPLNIPSLSQTS